MTNGALKEQIKSLEQRLSHLSRANDAQSDQTGLLKEKIEDYTNAVATMHQAIESERRYRVLSATALQNEVKDHKATEELLALERAHIRDYLHFLKSLNFTTENGNIIRTEKEGLKPTLQQGE